MRQVWQEWATRTEQRAMMTAESMSDVLEAAGFAFTGESGGRDEWVQRDVRATVLVKAETQWEFSRGQLSESGSGALTLEQFLEREQLL